MQLFSTLIAANERQLLIETISTDRLVLIGAKINLKVNNDDQGKALLIE